MTFPDIPDTDRSICLMAHSVDPDTGRALWLGRLKANGQIGAMQIACPFDAPGRLAPVAGKLVNRVLRILGGNQIIHFGLNDPIMPLDAVMRSAGKLPVDNPAFDIAPLARRIIAGDAHASYAPEDIFKRAGGCLRAGSLSEEAAPEEGRVLAEVFTRLVAPGLADSQALGTRRKNRQRLTSDIALSRHGLPFPCPLLPRLTPPPGGWRTDPWDAVEARDVALRYADGADLDALSELTSRSPRAIVTRLTRDGILQRS